MNVLVVGGSGFVGTVLTARLVAAGHRVVVPTRNVERARHLKVLPTAEVLRADVHDEPTLAELVRGKDAVVNLVGILRGGEGRPYGAGFARTHVELPKKLARAVQAAGMPRLLHMSALAADARAPSGYLRSKADGETAAFAVAPATAVTVFRPSVIFGRGDSFLTLFARLQRLAPLMPLACADARFQPVWVGDVAAAFVAALDERSSHGQTYNLCGPQVYSLRQLVAYAGEQAGCRRTIVGLPDALAYLQAWMMEWLPNAPLTRDNLRSMRVPSVCGADCAFPFGIRPAALEDVAPAYLCGL